MECQFPGFCLAQAKAVTTIWQVNWKMEELSFGLSLSVTLRFKSINMS